MTARAATSSIFHTPTKRVFSIDPGRPFLTDLASTLMADLAHDDPLALARATIFLPTRRSARALVEAFQDVAEANGQNAILLPAIKTLGDIDEDTLGGFTGTPDQDVTLPPSISPTQRLLTLATLVAAKERAFAGYANWASAVAAGRELGKLLDSFYTEEVDFDRLEKLVPEDYAAHWGQSIDFLKIITEQWPAHLAAINRTDPAYRRARLIDAQISHWRQHPPTGPTIIAGTTASAPAVARLVEFVSTLAEGAVILPGLDRALANSDAWNKIDAPHPQAGLKKLITGLGLTPNDVSSWPGSVNDGGRGHLISLALRPADATDDWRALVSELAENGPALSTATNGLSFIEAPDEDAEASSIAMIFRQCLDDPEKTAMLVTPDRNLGRRVALKLRRWDISVDDSGGIPFANSRIGTFLRLVAQWLNAPTNAVALIEMAQHPLACFNLSKADAYRAVDHLNKNLRGAVLPPTLDAALSDASLNKASGATTLLTTLSSAHAGWTDKKTGLANAILAHMRAAEIISAQQGTENIIWRGTDGREAADHLQSLIDACEDFQINPGDEYHHVFSELISSITVRHSGGSHPRLSILGPLEARMQTADIVVLGGLNEGVWPSDAGSDPFLSRPMRDALELPSPENKIGLAAHDFAQLIACPEVYLTRSRKVAGSPSTSSRWIIRLKNILSGADVFSRVDKSDQFGSWRVSIDEPATLIKIRPPAPRPPAAARPRSLYVTRVEKLMRDPYAIWARDILKLYKLDPLSPEFGPASLGKLLHKVFEDFVRTYPTTSPSNGEEILHALVQKYGLQAGFDDIQQAFWQHSLAETFTWFVTFHQHALEQGVPIILEEKGSVLLAGTPFGFTLKARVDRIDLLKDNTLSIVDYKSTTLPSLAQGKVFSPQLGLTGLIAQQNGFASLENSKQPLRVNELSYIRTLRRSTTDKNHRTISGADVQLAIDDARDRLIKLVSHYQDANTPFLSQPRPEFKDEYGDYDQLARRREWLTEDGSE